VGGDGGHLGVTGVVELSSGESGTGGMRFTWFSSGFLGG